MKILLIEDDDALIALLTRSLKSQHHIVDAVTDGEVGWVYASTFDYHLIILDIMLPKLDGISLCQKLRAAGYTTPILLLTAQDQITAKVQGLDAGADDYVVKPFDIAELIARVRALLRRSSLNPLPLLSWGDLVLNPSSCEVTYNAQPLTLTTKEYDLLELFLRDSSHVFSSTEIMDRLWSSDDFPAEATVRSHLRRLRHKLQAAGAPPNLIGTIHGRGYYLQLASSAVDDDSAAIPPQQETNISGSLSPPDEQSEQYFAFLRQTWVTTKPQCLARWQELKTIVDRLQTNLASYAEQQQAYQQAHKLVGTLGVFYLLPAMEMAREIEHRLAGAVLLNPIEATALQPLLVNLTKSIEDSSVQNNLSDSPGSPSPPKGEPHPTQLLLIDLDPALTGSLEEIATEQAICTQVLSMTEAQESYLASGLTRTESLPTIVLIQLSAIQAANIKSNPVLGFIHNIHQQYPHWVILVLGEHDELAVRLAILRQGGKFLALAGMNPSHIFTTALSLLQAFNSAAKVIVVDDDFHWLRTLPKLLQPWGLKVTTLAEPRQFLPVLRSIQPDALVLDIKMPEINGLELCQILRSDPQWQHLPILFLTASNDLRTQQEAFSLGADDYLQKPMVGSELAQRIRYRLERVQSLQVKYKLM
jgi:DNA-binding response OmpR family regulator